MRTKEFKRKSISKVIIWQVLGSLLLQGIGFFTTPVFTRILQPSDYGQTSTFSSWVSIVGIFIGLQLGGTIGIARNRIKEDEYDKYCSSILSLATCIYIVIQFVFIVFQEPLSVMMKFPAWLIPFVALQSYVMFITSFFSTKLEFEFRVELKTVISAFISVATIAMSLILALTMDKDKYLSKIFGAIIPATIVAIGEIVDVFSRGRTFFDKKYWKFAMAISIPLMLHTAAGIVFAQSDVIMLKSIVDESETGIYSLVYSLAIIIDILWTAFNHSWVPFYYEYKKKNDYVSIQKRSNGYLFVFTSITIGFLLCSPEVFKVLAPERYWSGLMVIPLVACAYYFNFLYSFPANHEFFNENTKLISLATVISAIVNIILNLLLIPQYHSMGAAVATVISYFVVFVIHDFSARYIVGNYEYTWGFYLRGLLPVVIFVFLYYYLMQWVIVRWLIAVGLGIAILVSIYRKKSIF